MRLSPNLRFPEFDGEWEEKKLKELGTFFSGGTPKTTNKNYYAGNISFIRSGEINSDVTELKISENGLNNSSAKMVNKGEILIALYGATSGEIAISKISGAINQAILCFQTKENKQFFKNLWEKHLNNILVTYLQGGQGNLSAEIIKRLKFYFPSSKEQVKISIFLEKIEERIELSNKIIGELKSFKASMEKMIFSQKLRLKDKNGNQFPKWNYIKGDAIFDNISDKNHNADLPILAITHDKGAIPRNLVDYNIIVTDKSVDSYKVVQTGDFIISLRSFQGGIEYSEYKGICSPAYIVLRPKINIDRRFFKYYLKTGAYIRQLNSKLEGIRDGKMVSYKYFSEIKIPLPISTEQIKIADYLSSVEDKINLEIRLLEQLKLQKKYLLANMFV